MLPKVIWQVKASAVVHIIVVAPSVAYYECAFSERAVGGGEFHQVIVSYDGHSVSAIGGQFGKQSLITSYGRAGIMGVYGPSAGTGREGDDAAGLSGLSAIP